MELNKKLVNFESMNENTKLTLAEALLYTKGLAGGYGGDFPLSTASKDSIYRVPATNKFYVCTENYNGSQISAPNSNFVELSVWKNHDRLNNLNNYKETILGCFDTKTLNYKLDFNKFNYFYVISAFGESCPYGSRGIIFKNSIETSSCYKESGGKILGTNYYINSNKYLLPRLFDTEFCKFTIVIGINSN